MASTTTDDNFFIEEPQKLGNNFFNKDKSIQLVELLTQKHHEKPTLPTIDKRAQINRIQSCRLTYNKKLQQFQHQLTSLQQHETNTNMPRSFVARLEELCKVARDTNDIGVAKSAVDTLIGASKSGCCFLERYIVMLINFCTNMHATLDADDTMKIKVDELLNRVLVVNFDRQQLTENLRKPEYKLTSVEHIIQLLQRVQDMPSKVRQDFGQQQAIDWLIALLDAHFVELATAEEAVDILDRISVHINFQCALSRETESTKCLLNSVMEQLGKPADSQTKPKHARQVRHKRPFYHIEEIEI